MGWWEISNRQFPIIKLRRIFENGGSGDINMAFHFKKLKIPGLIYIETDVFGDDRGFFVELFKTSVFKTNGIVKPIAQVNHSKSFKGVLRGLHYQAPPFAQGKLVQVLKGAALDVAVDIRFGSPTFGKYMALELTAGNKKQLWIPEGFAHGFLALEDDTLFSYKCTNVYSKENDRGIRWNDPAIGIEWGIDGVQVSEKDAVQPLLAEIKQEFTFNNA